MVRVDQAVKSAKSVRHVAYREIGALLQPGREEIVVADEVAEILLDILDRFFVIFGHLRQELIRPVDRLQVPDFVV